MINDHLDNNKQDQSANKIHLDQLDKKDKELMIKTKDL